MQCDAVGPRIAAEHGDRPAVGSEQAEQDPDRHRLPGAVRSEEAVDLAAVDLEIELVERPRRTERLDETRDRDDGLGPVGNVGRACRGG